MSASDTVTSAEEEMAYGPIFNNGSEREAEAEPELAPAGAGTPPSDPPPVIVGAAEPEEHPGQLPTVHVIGAGATEEPDPERPRRKVGIVGYTTSREEAPYADPEWELWGMNNLHTSPAVPVDRFQRWYNLHDLSKLGLPREQGGDPEHFAWLQQEHPFPIFLMDPLEGVEEDPESGGPLPSLAERTGFPSAVAFPKLQILARFPRYFTNTVSWQIAHLMLEAMLAGDEGPLLSDLGLWGIDMAVGTEYSAQRPSVEYFLGLIEGCGVQLHLPTASDLLKAAELYGGEDTNSGARAKIQTRIRELREQEANLENQLATGQQLLASVRGAIDSFAYMAGVWFPPAAGADGRDQQAPAPGGNNSAVGQLLADLDARERAPAQKE